MGKKRLRVALKVLGAVKEHFQDTKNFIKDLTDEQNISVEEVTFLQV